MNSSVLLIFLVFVVETAFALSPDKVVESSLKHHPLIIQEFLNLDMADADILATRGYFDFKLKGEYDERIDGYYDGRSTEGKIEKPLGFLNSEIFVGLRESDGSYPEYEGDFETLNGGELSAGFKVSLLRNNVIDENRLRLKQARENLIQSELSVQQRKVMIQTLALKSYWTWVVFGVQTKVYQELLDLALQRDKVIQKRIRAGDLAKIYGVENRQYVLKRQTILRKSENDFLKAAQYLSLFYRSEDGRPKIASKLMLPNMKAIKTSQPESISGGFDKVLSVNLEAKILQSQKEQALNSMRLSKNAFLPKLDLQYKYSEDSGSGDPTLVGRENRIMLSFSMPIEFRKIRGSYRKDQAKLSILENKLSFLGEKLQVRLSSLDIALKNSYEVYTLTKEQIHLTKKLSVAEDRRFRSGASDLILVNLREQSYAEAKVENLKSLLKYESLRADQKDLMQELMFK